MGNEQDATITLRDAGYRERAFVKSVLAADGRIDEWPKNLEWACYNTSRDTVHLAGEQNARKVAWEGSRSREILLEHEQDDTDCDDAAQKSDLLRDVDYARARGAALGVPMPNLDAMARTLSMTGWTTVADRHAPVTSTPAAQKIALECLSAGQRARFVHADRVDVSNDLELVRFINWPDESLEEPVGNPRPTLETLGSARLLEYIRSSLEKRLAPFAKDRNTEEARERFAKVLESYLRETSEQGPHFEVRPGERLGVFHIRGLTVSGRAFVERAAAQSSGAKRPDFVLKLAPEPQLSEKDQDYLDDLGSVFDAAPAGPEDTHLSEAYRHACERLEVNQDAQLNRVRQLATVEAEPEKAEPRIVRLVGALAAALSAEPIEWLRSKPWTDSDETADDYLARLAASAVVEADHILGWPCTGWPDVLSNTIRGDLVARGVGYDEINEEKLESLIALALGVADGD